MLKKKAIFLVTAGILFLVMLPLAILGCIRFMANRLESLFQDTVCEMQALSLEEKAVLGNVIGFDFPEDMTVKECRYTHSWDGSSLKIIAQYDAARLRPVFAEQGIYPKYTTQPYDTYEIAETQVEIRFYSEENIEFTTYNDMLNYEPLLQIGKNNG